METPKLYNTPWRNNDDNDEPKFLQQDMEAYTPLKPVPYDSSGLPKMGEWEAAPMARNYGGKRSKRRRTRKRQRRTRSRMAFRY
jgi:hypothetical protein